MPFYEVHHSYPLTEQQRDAIASSITQLHATRFTTPSMFVHVQFVRSDESGNTNYYMAGKRRSAVSNRIVGVVRTSQTRTKADFDALAQEIEEAWYSTVGGEHGQDATKKLTLVAFTPLLTVREAGVAAPEAGQEAAWFRENMTLFQKMAATDSDIADMLKEVGERDDLKGLLQ